ncbi:MAG: FkbM family methyltransferase [Phycisphaerales bacterium]|nr:FkbM family methyltransferase [Phycisphaerales bacterium]
MILRAIRDLCFPRGVSPRTIRFGLARGERLLIDFRYDTAFYFGTYESELNPYILSYVRAGSKCFDVGGHRGWDAIIFAKLSMCEVVSFEANAANVKFLRESAACSGRLITVVEKYVTACAQSEREITLDTAAVQYFMPDFIKIDVEGAELHVLQGAEDILRKRKPSLVIEVHSVLLESQCIELLRSFGYMPIIVNRKWRIGRERRGKGHNRWLVCGGESDAQGVS